MNIEKIIQEECKRFKIRMPKIQYDIESFYALGVCHISSTLKEEQQLFIAFHELRHFYQEQYTYRYCDSLRAILLYEFEQYHHLRYSDLFMEQEAYYYAYLKTKEFLSFYSVGVEAKEMITCFSKKYLDLF